VIKEWKMDMRFEAGNVRSPYRSGSLKTASRELITCKLDSLVVQDMRWGKDITETPNCSRNLLILFGIRNSCQSM
jgi:hypothetical protein